MATSQLVNVTGEQQTRLAMAQLWLGVGQLPAGAEDALGMLMESQGLCHCGPGCCILQAALLTTGHNPDPTTQALSWFSAGHICPRGSKGVQLPWAPEWEASCVKLFGAHAFLPHAVTFDD